MLHPVHAKIHQSVASDWTLHGPLTGALPCGLMVLFLPQHHTLTVGWKIPQYANFQDLLGVSKMLDASTLQCRDFASGLAWLKTTLNYEAILIVYQRLQAALIEAGLHGSWRVLVDQKDLYIESIDDPEHLFTGPLPKSLQRDLRALESAWIPSFSDTARCYKGEFTCRLPASSHARLMALGVL